MTVALSDTMLLCDMLRPLPDFSDSIATAEQTHAFYTRRKPLSATINTLANALYQVRLPWPEPRAGFHHVPGASLLAAFTCALVYALPANRHERHDAYE